LLKPSGGNDGFVVKNGLKEDGLDCGFTKEVEFGV